MLDSKLRGLSLPVPAELVSNFFLIPNQEQRDPVLPGGLDGSGNSGLGSEVAPHRI